MSKDQAIKIVKAAFNLVKKANMADDLQEKENISIILESFTEQIDQAIKILEESDKGATSSEMKAVLGHLKMGASSYERDVLDQIMDIVEGDD